MSDETEQGPSYKWHEAQSNEYRRVKHAIFPSLSEIAGDQCYADRIIECVSRLQEKNKWYRQVLEKITCLSNRK